jgi:CBS domain-containing protein
MKTLNDLIRQKGRVIYSVTPSQTVLDAVKMLDERHVGALLVMEGDRLSGVVSERDVARKVILRGKAAVEVPVRDIMTERVVCARPGLTIEEAMAIMTDKRIRHLPVVEDEKVVAVVSIGDLVKVLIEEQQFLIEQLESYITQ